MQVGHHHDRDLARVEAALAQLRRHVFAGLQACGLPKRLPRPPKFSLPSVAIEGCRPVSTRIAPALGWRIRKAGTGITFGARLAGSSARSSFSGEEAAARADHHRLREVDVAGDQRFDRDGRPGVPPASGSCRGCASTWTFIAG